MKSLPLFFIALLMCHAASALTIVGGGGSTASLSEGIAVGSDNVAYVFITPRHFIYSHAGAPATVGGIAVSSAIGATALLSSAASVGTDTEFQISELVSNLPGITPLPVLASSGNPADYLNLSLRVFGNSGATYGTQNSGAATSFILNDDSTPALGDTETVNLIDSLPGQPTDRYLFVDIRSQVSTPGTGLIYFGDSNGALVVNIGGSLAAAGAALGIIDDENPRSGGPQDVDVNVFDFAGHYKPQIDAYLLARTTALGTPYAASYIAPLAVVPEPARAMLVLLGVTGLLFRRARS